jgi:hypothetical protein
MINLCPGALCRFLEKAPIITPQYVAEKTIEGFRQNYEHLILPQGYLAMVLIR